MISAVDHRHTTKGAQPHKPNPGESTWKKGAGGGIAPTRSRHSQPLYSPVRDSGRVDPNRLAQETKRAPAYSAGCFEGGDAR